MSLTQAPDNSIAVLADALRHISATPPTHSPTLPTRTYRQIHATLNDARRMGSPLAAIVGPPAVGKTTALRDYASQNAGDTYYWQCAPRYDEKTLCEDVADHLGITTGASWRMRLSTVAGYLTERPAMFILDEVQRASYHVFDVMKYLAEESESTFVIAGHSEQLARVSRWRDISSRIRVKLEVEPLTYEDVEALLGDRYKTSALREMYRISKGTMRVLTSLTYHIDEAIAYLQSQGSDYSYDDLDAQAVAVMQRRVLPYA